MRKVALTLAVILVLFVFAGCKREDAPKSGKVHFYYGETQIEEELTEEEVKTIANILEGKEAYTDSVPACGFDENIYIVLGDVWYWFGCDGCGTAMNKKGFIDLSQEEIDRIHAILESYGCFWPCL